MPPTSVEKMLESMMMQMLNPSQTAANVVCCNCFKAKKKESRRSSNTSRKCCKSTSNTPQKNKKRRRKLKKSCLKTIICLTKMAKDGKCQGCSCDPCCGNDGGDVDERFCSKCGQLLPGMMPADQPLTQPDEQCLEQLQRCQQECKDMAVQANVERNQPLSVRIKVCPCPNLDPTRKDEKLYHSVSLPELSSTNPRLVDDATSGNLVSSRGPRTRLEDSNNDVSRQSQQLKGLNETTPEWPIDVASIKRLALNMAKARLVEEAACWEREYARRQFQQERQQEMDEPTEQPTGEQPTGEQPDVGLRKSLRTHSRPELKGRSFLSFEYGQGPTIPSTPGRSTYPNYHQTHAMDLCYEYPGITDYGVHSAPRQDTAVGCCGGTDVYCYSPENGPSPFGNHCEHTCTCGNTAEFQPYHFPGPYSGYQYHNMSRQHEYGEQDRPKIDPYIMSYGSIGNRPRSPCR